MKQKLFILTLTVFLSVTIYGQITPPAYSAIFNSTCTPASVSFTNVIQSTSTSTVNHNWVFGNGNTSISSAPSSQTYTNSGVYTIIDTAFIEEAFTDTYLKTVSVTAVSCSDPFNPIDPFLTLIDNTGSVDVGSFLPNTPVPVVFNYTNTANGFLLNPSTSYTIWVQDDDAVSGGIPGPADCGTISFNSNSTPTTFSLTNGGLSLIVELIRISGVRVVDTIVTATQFTINATPTITVNSGSICAGQSFTITPSGADTYTISGGNSIVSPTTDATYNVIGTDVNGCVSTATVASVTVNTLPVITVNSGSICSGESFTITPSGADTYTISGGNNIVSPTVDATYSVTGTDLNGCVSASTATATVVVNALPNIITSTSNTLLCTGQTASLTATGANTYTWSTTDNGTNIVVSPTVTSSYTVTGTDVNGCSNTSTITQSVSLCTGIEQLSGDSEILVSPNPFSNLITVKNTANNSTIIIIDVLGKVVFEKQESSTETEIDLSYLTTGLYQLIVKGDNSSYTHKIVKQ
jgi:hypothetical protein